MHFLEIFLQDKRLACATQEIGLNRSALCLYAGNTPSQWGNGSCRTRTELGTETPSSVPRLEMIYYMLPFSHL